MTALRPDADQHHRPIEDYGLLGDTRTAALVASNGAIDWLCIPRFDSLPVFGRLVGGPDAGTFRMGPAAAATTAAARRYRTDTATLETTWDTPAGQLTLGRGDDRRRHRTAPALQPAGTPTDRRRRPGRRRHRIRTAPRRSPPPAAPPAPRRRPGVQLVDDRHRPASHPAGASRSRSADKRDHLPRRTAHHLAQLRGARTADLRRSRRGLGRTRSRRTRLADMVWRHRPPAPPARGGGAQPAHPAPVDLLAVRCPGRGSDHVAPEDPGGIRNWDYRYAWPRDASIGIGAFLGVGKHDEARHFLAWLLHASRLDRPRLPVLLSLHGRHPGTEGELDGWPGYAHSRPVRIGNGAADQHQLDGYGWVLDAAWLLTHAGHGLYSETWRAMRGFADEVAKRWREPDAGIWEIRGDGAHHVHSKLMAWLALDRALRIADSHHTPARQVARWLAARNAVAADVSARGFNPQLGAYTRTYGSSDLDAAVLVLPLLGLEPRDSPRVLGTIDAVRRDLSAGGPLLYRYPPGQDGLPGTEGAFLPCSFWLVQALAATGQLDDAGELFDDLIDRASPLGLYAEEMDPASRRHLGNYPQALTHAALVQAALAIGDARRPRAATVQA